nr:MAG TPA: The ASCH domain adopts a beta-barrel fold similar to that of the PUA domain [Caudoviricetes sp.]
MEKAVLISIHPEWCQKIVNGEKTIEVRKTRPKMETPFKCYIYCTKDKHLAFMQNASGTNLIACMNAETAIPVGGFLGNGKVIGEFICRKIDRVTHVGSMGSSLVYPCICAPGAASVSRIDDLLNASCLSAVGLERYLAGGDGYGWHISNLEVYDTPLELSEFRRPCKHELYCESCAVYMHHDGICGNATLYLRRPPQSWYYVAEKEN